ncbi:hypothetical protein C0J52_11639 [Blattella germanica]|nr:hypothetical protein C0J52_11639 [Blattella germanica]
MVIMNTHYDALGCPRSATYEELKEKYQELVRIHHPDKSTDSSTISPTTFLKIDEAWKVLRDPDKRKCYDEQLTHGQLSEQPIIYETLELSELERSKDNLTYSYKCRCGGLYVIEQSEICLDGNYVSCEECSLIICIKGNSNKDEQCVLRYNNAININ